MDQEAEKCAPLMQDAEKERVIIVANHNVAGKILIREDTIINSFQGCAGCGRAQFTCTGVKKQWSALCWGKDMNKKYYCSLVLLSAVFTLSLLGAIFLCFTNSFNNVILSSMALRNNSLAYSMWKQPTVQPIMRVYLFNYTNWEKVKNNEEKKLHVEEVGPYVYAQHVERVNTKFNGDQLTYQEKNNFRYIPEKSVGSPYDQVFVPNLILMAAASKLIDSNMFLKMTVATTLSLAEHNKAFLRLPVERFLWGYDDDIYNIVKPFFAVSGKMRYARFGLLVAKNDTSSDVFTINTGANDKDRMNIIERFNGQESLSMWGSSECNSITSTDGSIFPPSMLDRNQTLHVFYANLCRRLPFHYTSDVEIADGIKLLRYSLQPNIFEDKEHNPANECYCELEGGTCPPRGVINVTSCAAGFPAFVSFPHFYNGDPKLTENITGLKPDKNIHNRNYVDIHPTLGIALRGKSSLQLNVQLKKSSEFGALRYLERDMILPVAWIEMSVEDLPESLQLLVYHGTYSTAAAHLGLAIFCILAFVVSSICLLMMIVGRRRKPCAIVKVAVENKAGSK